MKRHNLAKYFTGIAVKRLSEVETNPSTSNQHEFNGVRELHRILGKEKTRFSAKFLYLSDQDDGIPVTDTGFMTWYDAREKNPSRTEYRFYYSDNQAMQCASAGDLLIIAKQSDNTLLIIIAEKDTTIESQLILLFRLGENNESFHIKTDNEMLGQLDFTTRFILEQIGVEIEEEAPNFLETMLEKFHGDFPISMDFSRYVRMTLPDIICRDDPDAALIAWMEREDILFRTLEKHILGHGLRELLKTGEEEPEPYIKLIQSTLQRRKSRAGKALENHLSYIFTELNINYTRGGKTEGDNTPDFIFPDITAYYDESFNTENLTMLAAKRTCKDRWRQILNEAGRIRKKHLLTIEPGISEKQTAQMQAANVQLVIPRGLHKTYTPAQQQWLMTVREFTGMVGIRQERARTGK